jgi:hypothetical protein
MPFRAVPVLGALDGPKENNSEPLPFLARDWCHADDQAPLSVDWPAKSRAQQGLLTRPRQLNLINVVELKHITE